MIRLGGRSGGPDGSLVNPITEGLAGMAFLGVLLEEFADEHWNFVGESGYLPEASEAGAYAITAEHDVILARGFAHEADLGVVRTGAAVGAARHADDEFFVGDTCSGLAFFEFREELLEDAFRFGEGEATGRESRAGHTASLDEARVEYDRATVVMQ